MSSSIDSGQSKSILDSIGVIAQYIKDISFENPKAPSALFLQEAPTFKISVDVRVQAIRENTFEVILSIQVKSSLKEESIFILELEYAGLFDLPVNLSDAEKGVVLLVHCPQILFPYARRIISSLSQDGGFPPLMISHINFSELYAQRKQVEDDVARAIPTENTN